MKDKSRLNYFLLTTIMLFLFLTASGQSTVNTSGRVVDIEGEPVKNALVSLIYPPCKNCIDQTIIGYKTNSDGIFFLDGNYANPSKVRVFIEESVPDGYWNPISPSYLILGKLDSFRGITISKNSNNRLGDRLPTVRYAKILIPLNLIYMGKDTTATETLKLTIKSKDVLVANNIIFPRKFLDNETIKIVLPVFDWDLTFSYLDKKKKQVRKLLKIVKGKLKIT
jgi:hypothetical protein